MKNWIEKFNKDYPSNFDKKLDFIARFKKIVMKKYNIKKDKNKLNESERWGYYEKTFGYLADTGLRKTYQVDMETGDIIIKKD